MWVLFWLVEYIASGSRHISTLSSTCLVLSSTNQPKYWAPLYFCAMPCPRSFVCNLLGKGRHTQSITTDMFLLHIIWLWWNLVCVCMVSANTLLDLGVSGREESCTFRGQENMTMLAIGLTANASWLATGKVVDECSERLECAGLRCAAFSLLIFDFFLCSHDLITYPTTVMVLHGENLDLLKNVWACSGTDNAS